MLTYKHNFIGGERVHPRSETLCEVRSAHGNEPLGLVPLASHADVDLAVAISRRAFDVGLWSHAGQVARGAIVSRFRSLYAGVAHEIADLVSEQNGITVHFNRFLTGGLLRECEAHLAEASDLARHEPVAGTAGSGTLRGWHPVGVVAIIVPWNAPQQVAFSWLLPALLAGCVAILVLPPETALDGQRLGDLLEEAGLWKGVLSILVADPAITEYLAAHRDVDTVVFAGSGAAAMRIASISAGPLKNVFLDIQGRSTGIVLPDADLGTTVEGLRYGSMSANGMWKSNQTCLLTPRHRHVEFTEALVAMVSELRIGDPLDPLSFIGPSPSLAHRQVLQEFIELGLREGASLAYGGRHVPREDGGGNYMTPAIFAHATNEMSITRREILGPVITVLSYADIDDAIRLANDNRHRLSSCVWTSDEDLGVAVAERINAPTVAINGAWSEESERPRNAMRFGSANVLGTTPLQNFLNPRTISV